MYYSNGNYEAFAKPKKPLGIENKSAYLVGGGLDGIHHRIFRMNSNGSGLYTSHDRGVPEVFGAAYDIKVPFAARLIEHEAEKKLSDTVIMKLLQDYLLI